MGARKFVHHPEKKKKGMSSDQIKRLSLCHDMSINDNCAQLELSPPTTEASSSRRPRNGYRNHLRQAGSSEVISTLMQGVGIREQPFTPTQMFDPAKKIKGKHPPPSPSDVIQQREYVSKFFFRVGVGKMMVFDKTTSRDGQGKCKKLISYSDIMKISSLSPSELEEIQFIVVFLRANQGFTSHFDNSHKHDGWMWGIGWRVATETGVIIGRYLKISTIAKDLPGFKQVSEDAARAAEILGRWFGSVGDVALKANQEQMLSTGTPGFSILEMPENKPTSISKDSFANHLTYTNHFFANFPHDDGTDASMHAFMFSIPTVIKTGQLAPSDYDNSEEYFPFPDYRFYLDFSGHTFAKVIWGAKTYRHFTMPCKRGPSGLYDRTSGSVQVNQKSSDTTQNYYEGSYNNNPKRQVVSGYSHIVDRANQRNCQ